MCDGHDNRFPRNLDCPQNQHFNVGCQCNQDLAPRAACNRNVVSRFDAESPFQHSPRFPRHPTKEPFALPSRAEALTQRCAALSTTIMRLNAVVEPLTSTKHASITEGHIHDMQQEASNFRYAIRKLEVQLHEVETILDEIKRAKREEKAFGGGRKVRLYKEKRVRSVYEWS